MVNVNEQSDFFTREFKVCVSCRHDFWGWPNDKKCISCRSASEDAESINTTRIQMLKRHPDADQKS